MDDDSRIVSLPTKSKTYRPKTTNGTRLTNSPETRRAHQGKSRGVARRGSEGSVQRKAPLPTRPKKICWLYQLPVEILEMIFFASLETNMALASPWLGRILSSETVFRVLIRFAFFDPHFVKSPILVYGPLPLDLFRPAVSRVLKREERLGLQQVIMSKKWFTLERFEKQVTELVWLVAGQGWHPSKATSSQSHVGQVSQPDSKEKDEREEAMLRDAEIKNELEDDMIGALYLSEDELMSWPPEEGPEKIIAGFSCLSVLHIGERHLNPRTWNASASGGGRAYYAHWVFQECVGNHHYYIRPPSEVQLTLRLLVRLVQWQPMVDVVDRQYLLEGLKTAALDSNYDSFRLLVEVVAHRFLRTEMDSSKSEGWRDLLRFVSQIDQKPKDWFITRLFEKIPPMYVDKDDPVLIKWALSGLDQHEIVKIMRAGRGGGQTVRPWFLIAGGLEPDRAVIWLDDEWDIHALL